MSIFVYKGYEHDIRFYTTAELKAIDENLPDTGASTEPGFYYDELDNGERMGAPCGPHRTEEAAKRACRKVCNWVEAQRAKKQRV